jgi:type I restriction enzyme, S subunit
VDHVDSYLFDGDYLLIAKDGENLRTRNTPIAFLARGKFWVNNHAHIVRGNREADTRFLMYALSAADISGYLTGSTMPKLTQGNMNRIPLLIPPLPEQCAIAHILGTLDDKIELNRRMNETLETMARALFKSWFVDFDPVRAKAEGRDPGLPTSIADLFPDCFEDSNLGEVPEGWHVGRLDGVLVLQRGFDLPTPKRTIGPYPVIAASGPNGSHNQFMVRGPGVITGRSGVLGNVFYVHEDFWPLNTCLWVKQFKHSTPAFAFHLLRGLDFSLYNAGSAVPTLNRNHVHNLPVIVPSMSIIQAFEDHIVPLMKRQKVNVDETRTLATLRDALLPKLFSGELRIKDVERFIGRQV